MDRRAVVAALLSLPAGAARALYDAAPDEALAAAQGEWRGTLTYRDYQRPDRLVTLPTRLFAALAAPAELVLHFVFDDGPAKTVYSYERMQFDFAAAELRWFSGPGGRPPDVHRITSVGGARATRQLTFERADAERRSRHVLALAPAGLSLSKDELSATGEATFRNRYEFVRPGA